MSNTEEEEQSVEEDVEEEDVSSNVFTEYVCFSNVRGRQHPANICEASSLSVIRLPKTDYPLQDTLPPGGPIFGNLSSLQLESVLYTCSKHQEFLPDGQRPYTLYRFMDGDVSIGCGFFIGDGPGVGKGRQISAIIFDNYARGRTKHLWVSTSADLHLEARRDINDLGCSINVINGFGDLDKAEQKRVRVRSAKRDTTEGVLFVTYHALVSTQQGNKRRLDQVIAWLGGATFDGVLCFDECHKAKNYCPKSSAKSSKTASYVIELQNKMPLARVVYCSATGVSDVGDMGYVQRLGLWGRSTTFHSFDDFYRCMKYRGVSFLEMLAMEMKAEGKYVARTLSFKGTEFEIISHRLTEEQVEVYNAATAVWQELEKLITEGIQASGNICSNEINQRSIWMTYWATHQRFFRSLCLALKAEFVVKLIQKKLEEGYCVVVGLQSTGEAALNLQDLSVGDSIDKMISSAKIMLRNFVERSIPTVLFARAPESSDSDDDDPPLLQMASERKAEKLQEIDSLELPADFLDCVINALGGHTRVAEMTGRKMRLEKTSPDSYVLVQRASQNNNLDSINVEERHRFMRGEKLIGIVSDAGSTGISLHADRNCANKRRRVHITVELPWSADKAIQQLGRTHRSNQESGPIYQLVCTNIGGEQRFISAAAKRLQSLGAITRGDRRAAANVDISDSNFDSDYGRKALKRMLARINLEEGLPFGVTLDDIRQNTLSREILGYTDEDSQISNLHKYLKKKLLQVFQLKNLFLERKSKAERFEALIQGNEAVDINRFFNRLLGLKVNEQALLFNYFFATLQGVIASAKMEGVYLEGISDIQGKRVTRGELQKELWVDPITELTTYQNNFIVDRGMSFQEASTMLDMNCDVDDKNGFFQSKKPVFRSHVFILAIRKKDSPDAFKIFKPNTGLIKNEITEQTLFNQYRPIQPGAAERPWTERYEMALEDCIHGYDCANRENCTVGMRQYNMMVLSGSVVRIWGVLDWVLSKNLNTLKAKDHVIKTIRVPLQNQEHLVGVKFPECLLSEVVVNLERDYENRNERILNSEAPAIKRKEDPSSVKPQLLEKLTKKRRPSISGENEPPLPLPILRPRTGMKRNCSFSSSTDLNGPPSKKKRHEKEESIEDSTP